MAFFKKNRACRWTIVGAALLGPHALAAPVSRVAGEPFFTGLGHLPGGASVSWANAVSADGRLVVGTNPLPGFGNFSEGFVWTMESGMVGLGGLEGQQVNSEAHDVSDGGVVVGTVSGHPFRWTAGGGFVLLDEGSTEFNNGQGFAVSDDGSVVVGVAHNPGPNQGFRWTEGTGMVGLGWLNSDPRDSFAFDVSGDGTAVSGISFSPLLSFGVEPTYWTPANGLVGLGDVPGGVFYALAWGISADGLTVVGDARLDEAAAGIDEAFLWTQAGGFVFLDPLRGELFGSTAQAASADGSIVVGYADTGAMIWDAEHGMRNIQTILTTEFGLDLAGWTLGIAYGVSADGSAIVGSGTNPAGESEAWIAQIPLPAGPVPAVSEWGMATLALLTLTGGTLVIRTRKPSSL